MRTIWLATGVLAAAGVGAVPVESHDNVQVGVGFFVGDSHAYRPHAFRLGFERGRHEGSEHGFADGRRGRTFNFWHASEYRHAGEGYRGWMGPKWEYASGFRSGYEQGYRRAFGDGRRIWANHRHGRWDEGDRFLYEKPTYRDRHR